MSERTVYHAVAKREDGWWVITVPEFDIVTQARRLDQVEHMARDLIAVWLEVDYETVSVDIEVRIPEAWRDETEQARRLREEAERAQEAAASRARPEATEVRIAVCGSRAPDTDTTVVDAAVRCLARLVMAGRYQVSHGPVGVGSEVLTYIADHYHPPSFTVAVGLFGRRNVVRSADYVLVIGGGAGTQDEIDLALSMGKKIIALPASGGTARRFHDRARRDLRLRGWMTDEQFTALETCTDAEEFTRLVERLLSTDHGAMSD